MQKQPEDFLTEIIDDQIDHALYTEDHIITGSVVRDLQELYEQGDSPEQVRHSLDAIWSRLADRISPENQTMFSMPETDSQRLHCDKHVPPLSPLLNQEQVSQAQANNSRKARGELASLPPRSFSGRSDKHRLRRTLAFSALAAIILPSVFSWVLVTHLASQANSRLGSGSGTSVPTVPSTPMPQSLRDQAQHLLSQFHQEVTGWGQVHQYRGKFNDQTYELDYAYDHQGMGGLLDHMVQQARSAADYQAAIDQIQNALTNLYAMESNFTDQTPWNHIHRSDNSLLSHYQLAIGMVVVVSLLEQSMRVYQNGQLVNAFQITTGGYEVPSLPGSWQIIQRSKNVTLVSAYPKGSPDWYPPTLVQHMLSYHTNGYSIIDSWWRETYGVGTNFPHHDSSGNPISNDGSTGTINLSTLAMTWLYNNVQMNTPVIIY